MGFFDRRTISILVTILAFAGVLAVVWLARLPLIAFLFAIFFAHLLEPVVDRFQGWLHVSRGKSVAITYVAIFGGLLIFGLTAGPKTLNEVERLSQTLPSLFENFQTGNIAREFGGTHGWSMQTQARIQDWLVGHQESISTTAKDVEQRLRQLASNLPWVFLVPILAVFFLKDRSELRNSVLQLISRSERREFIEHVMDDLDTMLGQYVRAQLLLSFFAFIAYGVFLLIVRFPYALATAAIGGVLEFIPFVGPLLTLGIFIAIALLTGYSHWIAVAGFWLVWRGVQDYVNTPRVMGQGLDLHPLLAIFAILVGEQLGGVLGVYLSIPTVAALRILWLNWTRKSPTRKAA
jgi:predicted PurR-regulated permease PerM